MKSTELIQRYFLGIASNVEVQELEFRLQQDEELQDEFLLQADIDTLLRQEAQTVTRPAADAYQSASRSSLTIWKWVSGVSTLAAAVLLGFVLLNITHQAAQAYPMLGRLTCKVSRTEQNIWAAAADGGLVAIREELADHQSINAKLECGLAPLHIATLFNQRAAVELLLAEGANTSLTDHQGNTALHMASFLGNTDIVRYLLAAGADPEIRNGSGFNASDLVGITWSKGLEQYYHSVERVLKTKIDLERIRAERPVILKLLSTGDRAAPDRKPNLGIWRAAMTGNTAAIVQHIAASTPLNEKEDLGGSTPLILAAIYGQPEVAKLLIDAGADLEMKNHSGGTALHLACFFCQPRVVELLLNAGADINQTNNRGMTPSALASVRWSTELEGIYEHVYTLLNLPFDREQVQHARGEIAEILKRHKDSGSHNPLKTPN